MGDNLSETYHAGNMRPSYRPESVQEVLDIIQKQNHYSRHPATQSGDVAKSRNPLPAIKGSAPPTSRQLQDTLDGNNLDNDVGFQLDNSRFDYQDLRKHTQRLDLNDQNHILSGDMIKTTPDVPSVLQREGTRHQLPPLSLRSESRSNNSHSDWNTDDSKRGTISSTQGQDSNVQHNTQARPSTGYGRRLRAASFGEELSGSESRAAQGDQKSSVSQISSKGKSCKNDQRPRSSYGSRIQREQSQETIESIDSSSNRDTTYTKHDDLNTKQMTNKYGKPTLSNNKHRPLRVCRSHGSEHDQEQERDITMSNTTFARPKSGKGRCRHPPSPRISADGSMGMDLVRPGAPTPPSDILDDGEGFNGDSYARNHTSRLMTL